MRFKAPTMSADVKDRPVATLRRDRLEPDDAPFRAERPKRSGESAAAGEPDRHRRPSRGRRVTTLVWFSRQLYLLTSSGMQIVEALESLARQAKDGAWKSVLRDVCARVQEGDSMSEAMAAHPYYFDPVYRSLIAAGESGGKLKEMLNRVTALATQQLQVRRAVIGALIYPCLLLSAASGALTVMVVVVLPRFTDMFESLRVPLPPTTKTLVGLSDFVRSYWFILLAVLAVVITAFVLFLRTPRGKRIMDSIVLRLPKFGPLVKSFATARIARLLGTLIASQVPVLTSFKLVHAAMGNSLYADLIEKGEAGLARGESVSAAFSDASLVSPSVYEAVRSGEQSGRIGELLLDVAEFLDEENQSAIKALTSTLEPLILLVLGVVVGFVAVSLFTPLFDITANSS